MSKRNYNADVTVCDCCEIDIEKGYDAKKAFTIEYLGKEVTLTLDFNARRQGVIDICKDCVNKILLRVIEEYNLAKERPHGELLKYRFEEVGLR